MHKISIPYLNKFLYGTLIKDTVNKFLQGVMMKHCLSIAGSDCSGGAGIQADLKTFSAHGTFGMSVITAVVAENTSTVLSVLDVPQKNIIDQIDAVFEDITVHGVKVGMLSDKPTMEIVAKKLKEYQPQNVVIDPVMIAKGGFALMQSNVLTTLNQEIIPLAYLLTPNIPEAETILGKEIKTIQDMKAAAKAIYNMGAKNVLIKGGHLEGDSTDILYNGLEYFTFNHKRIPTKNTHGTGCTLSSAITANLAKDQPIETAVENAKNYVTNAIRFALDIGKGHGPTNHFYDYYQMKGFK